MWDASGIRSALRWPNTERRSPAVTRANPPHPIYIKAISPLAHPTLSGPLSCFVYPGFWKMTSSKGGYSGERFGSWSPFAEPPWYNAINSPYYNNSHRRLRKFIREYVDEHIIPHCEEWERNGSIPKEAADRHVKLGFVAAGIFPPPVEYMSNIKLPAGIPANGAPLSSPVLFSAGSSDPENGILFMT